MNTMERKDNNEEKQPAVEQYDKTGKKLEIGESPINPATNNNEPFEEGQFETENELPQQNKNEEKE